MRIVLTLFMLLHFIACASQNTHNKTSGDLMQKQIVPLSAADSAFFSTAEKIAWNHYQEYLASGMNHSEALLMLRRYNGNMRVHPQHESLKIEAEQRIDYFCIMQDEKKRFGSTHQCKDWAESALLRCEVFEFGYYSPRVVSCLRRELEKSH